MHVLSQQTLRIVDSFPPKAHYFKKIVLLAAVILPLVYEIFKNTKLAQTRRNNSVRQIFIIIKLYHC